MFVTQKSQYALRAIFELACKDEKIPLKIARIAKAQAIPPRFLEVILGQLKRGEFVKSKRGNNGGYELARLPSKITVGEIIRFIDGPLGPVDCVMNKDNDCTFYGDCVFMPMWEKAQKAVSDVYDGTTFQDLVEMERERVDKKSLNYEI